MRSKLEFLWIDDAKNREKTSDFFDEDDQIKCKFEYVQGDDLIKIIFDNIFQRNEPDLILIDHRLQDVKLKNVDNDFRVSGASYAEIIREKWPDCPIVCVTAASINDIALQQKAMYDAVYSGHEIRNSIKTLISIALSNKTIKNNKPQNTDTFIKLLNAPEDDWNRLASVIPDNILLNYGKEGLAFEISKWVRKTLIAKPGFLFNKQWTATFLGIKESSISKIQHYFDKAIYNGIYSSDKEERWWQTGLKEILFSKFPNTEEYLPWKLGINFNEIDNNDLSKCYVCKEKYPETVAYTDDRLKKRVQVHLKCSKPFENAQKQLYFEEIRLIEEL